ncbi:hypothetical protein QUB19_16515 [Microcoleus sp. B4-C5]|uniref:hypothetical protein n=1 Tax=unclassified Microcoleus TaxID=2642155 RepID=UPI002FD72F34
MRDGGNRTGGIEPGAAREGTSARSRTNELYKQKEQEQEERDREQMEIDSNNEDK